MSNWEVISAKLQKTRLEYVVVDLDDTLIKTDLILEMSLLFLKKYPLSFFKLLSWAIQGPLKIKKKLSEHIKIDPQILPYRKELIEELKKLKKDGVQIILASASRIEIVSSIAKFLDLFNEFIGTTDLINAKGQKKLDLIRGQIKGKQFAYIGDSSADVPIWENCNFPIAINPTKSIQKLLKKLNVESIFLFDKKTFILKIIKQLRPHQWVKNFLILTPLVAAHRLSNLNELWMSLVAIASFSVAASAVYVFNDLLDIHSDRAHRTKKNRPFASGDLPMQWGLFMAPIAAGLSLMLSYFLPLLFTSVLILYFLLNILYSFKLKKEVIVDTIVLTGMYALRIFAGSAATGIPVSSWLMTFSIFFFFSLASVKRFTEINRNHATVDIEGRGYRKLDSITIYSIGVGSGLISLLVLSLYFNSPDVTKYYSNSQQLWLIVPILLYWMSRLWLLANRNLVHDDPVLFAIKDKPSWLVLLLTASVVIFCL